MTRKTFFDEPAFEAIVSQSKGAGQIARVFNCNTSTVYRTLKRFGLKPPPQWGRVAAEALVASRPKVPEVIISNELDRAWVGSLVGGEGCIAADYVKKRDKTMLVVVVRMSDKEWVDHFAQLVDLSPSGERLRGLCKTQWDKAVSGLRALKVLIEILPYL